mmetsp:Transcript_50044/g.74716  ORF Transcript_50044/g.74716 Transcript_50044/m.74716 type:complete len:104 (+) Transcript_50044:1538-1849(+)
MNMLRRAAEILESAKDLRQWTQENRLNDSIRERIALARALNVNPWVVPCGSNRLKIDDEASFSRQDRASSTTTPTRSTAWEHNTKAAPMVMLVLAPLTFVDRP